MSILRTFLETKCEACNGHKTTKTAFCKGCYYALPHDLRSKLWNRFAEGFEQAYTDALAWLQEAKAEAK